MLSRGGRKGGEVRLGAGSLLDRRCYFTIGVKGKEKKTGEGKERCGGEVRECGDEVQGARLLLNSLSTSCRPEDGSLYRGKFQHFESSR